MSRILGRASEEGTTRFQARAVERRQLPAAHFRAVHGGLQLTSLGLGTYHGAPDGPTDLAVEQAVSICLTSGRVNVIDTAINYRSQRAERSVGRALARTFAGGEIDRSEVFVATKGGYLAPDGEADVPAQRWIERELLERGVLDPADIVDGSHAMSRSYLADQFERSRDNLGVEVIDLVYAHNAPDAQLPAIGRDAFLDRLSEAFRLYETLRDAGALGTYGLATWDSLRSPPDSPEFLDLESAVRIAREVGGEDHGFRFIQFPFNIAMPEAARIRNQPIRGERHTLFDAARSLGIGCFTSVPILSGGLARGGPRREGLTSAQTAIQFARSAPGSVSALVGQKTPQHLSENLELASRPPWPAPQFEELLR